jgi:SAM-dependent methyltransferase
MERLSLRSRVSYNATEAAIHLARYQLAAPYCQGKHILDIACGEGYGAYALKQAGAASVDGVDNSPEAISSAQTLFTDPGIHFFQHDAERVDELFSGKTFDVIVSLETIEHLQNPTRFLRSISKLAHDQTVIIITCPNDHWYYATDDLSNPYHVKKYSFEAFRKLTTVVLGSTAVWGLGVPVVGFGTITEELTAPQDSTLGQIAMLDFREQASAIALPPAGFSNVGLRNCSYFVGIWGGTAARIYSSAVVPISMDHYTNLVSWETARLSPTRIGELEKERSTLLFEKQQIEQRTAQLARDAEGVLRESEAYRIQAFALGRELDLVSRGQAQALARLEQLGSDLEQARRGNIELTRQLGEVGSELEQTRRGNIELSKQKGECENSLEAARAQALRLTGELNLAHIALSEVRGELAAIELRRQATLKYRIVAANKGWMIGGARRVKPYLPEPFLKLAQRIARTMGL